MLKLNKWLGTKVGAARGRRATLPVVAEQLEIRLVPAFAGIVVATLAANGNITLTGDNQNNGIEIEVTDDGTDIFGRGDTLIKFGNAAPSSSIHVSDTDLAAGNISVSLGKGNDSLEIDVKEGHTAAAKNVTIDMGDGNDEVFSTDSTGNIHVANLTVNMGDGNNTVDMDALDTAQITVDGILKITSGKGNDLIRLNSFSAEAPSQEDFDSLFTDSQDSPIVEHHIHAGTISITTGAQNDVIGLGGVTVDKDLTINSGILTSSVDDDVVALVSVSVGGNLTVTTGGSQDVVAATDVDVLGSVRVDTGDGFDKVLVSNSSFASVVNISLGKGDDLLLIGPNVEIEDPKKVTIDGGPGHDVASRIVNELRAAGAKVTGGIVNVSESFDSQPVFDRLYAGVSKLFPEIDP